MEEANENNRDARCRQTGKSSILNAINNPNDNIANISPSSILPSNVDNVIFAPII